jgi:hypothetical protein
MAAMRQHGRQPERQAEQRHAGKRAEGAEHHQVALREAHRFGGLVDEHEAQRDQPVDAALRDARQQELKDLHGVLRAAL